MSKVLLGIVILVLSVSAIDIKLSQAEKQASPREVFWTDILKFVLDHAEVPYTISVSYEMTQSRVIKELKENSGLINLHVMGTSEQLEKELLPIRIPVTRGLVGHRVFIIHKDNQSRFSAVKSLEDLQKLRGVQGLGWTDIEILEHSGLKQGEMLYKHIFKVINFERTDYFSRSIHEAYGEVEAYKKEYPNLAVEKEIVLIYPFALLAFTSPQNRELAKVIEDSFIKAYDDGVFIDYFYNHPHIKEALKMADLENRRVIQIPNPFLTKETASIPSRYWHNRQEKKGM